LCIRCDALGKSGNADIGISSKEYIEKRLNFLASAEGTKGGYFKP